MDLAERIIASISPHPAVREIRLVGSRAERRASALSDWDFRVESSDFPAVAEALPQLVARLDPLAQQWDRLSPEWCWMLILRGPAKVDLIFPNEPHTNEPPWQPNGENLDAIDAHFWDWMLWLKGKEAGGKAELVASELDKLFGHLLAPLGVSGVAIFNRRGHGQLSGRARSCRTTLRRGREPRAGRRRCSRPHRAEGRLSGDGGRPTQRGLFLAQLAASLDTTKRDRLP